MDTFEYEVNYVMGSTTFIRKFKFGQDAVEFVGSLFITYNFNLSEASIWRIRLRPAINIDGSEKPGVKQLCGASLIYSMLCIQCNLLNRNQTNL